MLVGHLSDLHVVAQDEDRFGFDTAGLAAQAVAHLNGLDPAPDVVVVTGDVANAGLASEYEHARSVLDELTMPYWVIPGNHDRRAPLIDTFDGRLGVEDGRVNYSITPTDHPLRLVMLDTLSEGHDEGRLGPEQLGWLDKTLDADRDTTIVFCHHPPAVVGIGWMDDQALEDTDELREVLTAHPHAAVVACGHLHRQVSTQLGPTRVAVAPSTAPESIALTLGDNRRGVCSDPARVVMHALVNDQVVTHTTFLADSGFFPV